MLGRKFLRTAPSTPVPPHPAPGPVRVSHTDCNKYFRMLKTLISYIHIDRYTELMGVMQELKTLGVIPVTFIREIRYMRDESDDHLNCFEVVTFQTRYVVSAECQEDMRAWASAIVYARNLHLNQGHGSKKVGSLKVDILDVEKLRMCSGEVLWFRGK